MLFDMRSGLKLGTVLTVLFFAGDPALTPAVVPTPPPTATKFLTLFDQLRAAEGPAGTHQHIAFQFSESEINEYLRYSLKTTPRPGVDSVTVKIFPYNYISTFTVIDFDAVERWHPGTIPGVLRPVLKGKKSLWLDCRFQVKDAKATCSVEKSYYQHVRLPAFLVQKVIQIVAARQPEKYDTAKPVPLPFGLRQVRTANHAVMGEN